MTNLPSINPHENHTAPAIWSVDRFFTLAQEMFCILDYDGFFKRVNPAVVANLGYTEDELRVTRCLDLVHPDDRAATAALFETLKLGAPIPLFQNRYRCRDGSYKWLTWTCSPAEGVIYAISRDITAYKQAVDARAHLAAIVESSDDAIVSKTMQGIIQTWNQGAERIFGYTADEVIGKPITILFPPDRLAEENFVLDQITHGKRVEHYETVRVRKDGTHIPISLTVSPIRDSEGQIIGASKIAQDITNRKEAEYKEKLLVAHNERQRLARDLHDAVSQALFSANVLAQSLPRLKERNPEKAFELLEQIHQLIQGATAEMRTLLFELRPENLVNTRLEDLLAQLCRGIQTRKRIQTSIVFAGADTQSLPEDAHIALYRIAQESINNIARHANAQQLRVRLHRRADQVELIIVDNGQGFDASATSAGFGLNSMRERAANINASIKVKSKMGVGTRIQVVWTR